MLPWDELPASAWPLVATFRDVLDMLNSGLPEPFLFGSRAALTAIHASGELDELPAAEAEVLEAAETGEVEEAEVIELAAVPAADAAMTSVSMAAKEVDMETFLRLYWPHFNQARLATAAEGTTMWTSSQGLQGCWQNV